MRALIVDDSRAMRSILAQILRELGFTTSDAANGVEALKKLKEEGNPDLVLLDWNMPEMNGYDVVQAVRSDHSYDGVPIMMVTTETEMEQMARALEAGANEYVMKPFTKDVIAEKLEILGIRQV